MTSRSAPSGSATARTPSSRASSSARARAVAVPDRHLAARVAQRPHRRARAAARAEHQRARGLRRGPARSSAAISPGASVFSAAILPSGAKVSVFAAPIARAASLASSASASAACLCGIVTFAPRKPDAAERARGLGEQLRRHRQALVAPPVHAERRQRRVVHRRRAAVRDRPAEHAQAGHHCPAFVPWDTWRHHRLPRSCRGRIAIIASCSPAAARRFADRRLVGRDVGFEFGEVFENTCSPQPSAPGT